MTLATPNMKLRGSLSIFLCASLWGLFWIPLRYFDESGIHSLWAVVCINFAASLIAIPAAFWFGSFKRENIKWLVVIGLGMGAANIFYFAGLILSDVVRVTFLFYLLPIWATLFSKIIFNIPIGKIRMISLGFAIAGIWFLLGAGGWPVPQNIGDIFGILAGMFWALGLTLIRGKSNLDSWEISASALFSAFVMALVLGVILRISAPEIQPAAPELATILKIALPLTAFSMLILWPTMLGQLWGAKYVVATTAALLTMSEILMATISTTLLDATDLSWISWAGAGLILVAIIIDLLADNPEANASKA